MQWDHVMNVNKIVSNTSIYFFEKRRHKQNKNILIFLNTDLLLLCFFHMSSHIYLFSSSYILSDILPGKCQRQ